MSAASDATLRAEIRWAAARAFTDPLRMYMLFAGGPSDVATLARFLGRIVPAARRQIGTLAQRAGEIPDISLRNKALYGLRAKGYHIAGASLFAAYLRGAARESYLRVIAPLETIYDFLDTVCDTEPVPSEDASRIMHRALSDALDPSANTTSDYFSHMSGATDAGYLRRLVDDVRTELLDLSYDSALSQRFNGAARLYAETQTLKHLPPHEREAACSAAFEKPATEAGVTWFEYAAASGSQFHVYAPLFVLLARRPDPCAAYDAYFPEVAAIHVLLDAFIDQAEDLAHGELNWIDCYNGIDAFEERFALLARRAYRKLSLLDMPASHCFTLRLMIVFYLTHPKVWQQRLQHRARRLLQVAAAEMT